MVLGYRLQRQQYVETSCDDPESKNASFLSVCYFQTCLRAWAIKLGPYFKLYETCQPNAWEYLFWEKLFMGCVSYASFLLRLVSSQSYDFSLVFVRLRQVWLKWRRKVTRKEKNFKIISGNERSSKFCSIDLCLVLYSRKHVPRNSFKVEILIRKYFPSCQDDTVHPLYAAKIIAEFFSRKCDSSTSLCVSFVSFLDLFS